MNNYRENIISRAKKNQARIVLPEIDDKRIAAAIVELKKIGFQVLDLEEYNSKFDNYLEYIKSLNFTKNWPVDSLIEYLKNPLNFGLAMVACNDADCLIAGAAHSSSDVIRAAIRLVGVRPDSNNVSSIFFMIDPVGEKAFTYADCAVIPEPDKNQLAEIAAFSAKFHQLLSEEEPIVAFLSFSSKGSANHYRVDKVKDTVKIFAKKYPYIIHDGEIQFDAAIVPEINFQKAPDSPIKGNANVLIFPNLDAANIAYKITQRLAGYSAWGPLLQGLNKPIHDLSRGCNVEDIINVSAIAALQKNYYANI